MSDTCNKHIIVYSILLGVLCMILMLHYNLNKEVVEAAVPLEKPEQQGGILRVDGTYDEIYTAVDLQHPLTISLPSVDAVDSMVLSEEYAMHCVRVSFEGLPHNYFEEHPLTGNAEGIRDIVCGYEEGRVVLYVYLAELLACQEDVEGSQVRLSFQPIRKVYDRIVVVDPGHGGEEEGLFCDGVKEKDVALKVVLRLKELLDETDVKVLYTRLEDKAVANQARIALANEANADLFLSVHCALNDREKECRGITTYYNETFFIPDFGNADFAFEVEDKTVRAVTGKALGLEAGEKYSDLLKYSMVPTAYVEIGYLSNETERKLLLQEDYIEKVARGLYDAIMSSYDKMTE